MKHMVALNISVLCIQETQYKGVHHYLEDGLFVILSGCDEKTEGRANAGVGFIVAPWDVSYAYNPRYQSFVVEAIECQVAEMRDFCLQKQCCTYGAAPK